MCGGNRAGGPLTALLVAIAMAVMGLAFGEIGVARAQAPDDPDTSGASIFLPFVTGGNVQAGEAAAATEQMDEEIQVQAAKKQPAEPIKLIVDADPGVDDALAIIYLLNQDERPVDLLGLVTVAGNNSIDNVTYNARLVRTWLELDESELPIVPGAAQPLSSTLSLTQYYIMGPDGLWYSGTGNALFQYENPLSDDAVDFYCGTVGELAEDEKLVVLALGPLTNLAHVLQSSCAGHFVEHLERLVVLGGAKYGGNITPVAESNFWQDPEAVDVVLQALEPAPDFSTFPPTWGPIKLQIVPFDAFRQTTVDRRDVEKLIDKGNSAVQQLGPALLTFVDAQLLRAGEAVFADPVAAALVVQPGLGNNRAALVRIVLEQNLSARGQSIIGLGFAEKIGMSATDAELSKLAYCEFVNPWVPIYSDCPDSTEEGLGTILFMNPDNAQFVAGVHKDILTKNVFHAVRR